MNLDLTIVPAQLELLLWAQVLIAEEDNAPLGNQQSQFVFLLVIEILELEANNFGSDMRGQVLDFLCRGKQGSLARIGASASVNILAVVVADGVDILKVEGTSRAVLSPVNTRTTILRILYAQDSLD